MLGIVGFYRRNPAVLAGALVVAALLAVLIVAGGSGLTDAVILGLVVGLGFGGVVAWRGRRGAPGAAVGDPSDPRGDELR